MSRAWTRPPLRLTPLLASCPLHSPRFFASTILEGVRSVEAHLATQSCASLDNLLSFAVTGRGKTKPDQAALVLFDLINSQSSIFYEVEHSNANHNIHTGR
jgi:hypothetical protein